MQNSKSSNKPLWGWLGCQDIKMGKKELVLSEEKYEQGKSPLPLCSESAICHSRD